MRVVAMSCAESCAGQFVMANILVWKNPSWSDVTTAVVDEMIAAYPHLADATALLTKVVDNEEERFRETLEHGLALA